MKTEITHRVALTSPKQSSSFLLRGTMILVMTLMTLVSISAEARAPERQYVFALDDSGSMGNPKYKTGNPGNDPYRLSRFAVRALLGALPDEVAATIITMGNNSIDTKAGPKAQVPPLAKLAQNRSALNALLNAPKTGKPGPFTSHDYPNTPCQRILDGIAKQLNGAYREGTVQTAIYLSDGRCTDRFSTQRFLDSLESEKAAQAAEKLQDEGARPFQFYFICMGDEVCSKEFVDLAEKTGGASYVAGSAAVNPQPDELLSIFGQTIGRSLDLCPSEISSTARSDIPSFHGASFTQLVAVPGSGESLEWNQGVANPKMGEHFWKYDRNDVVFRFYTARLPTGHPATSPPFDDTNATRWRLLAIPYYRELRPVVRILRGKCDIHGGDRRDGPHVIGATDSLPVGGTVCAELVLEGEGGVVLRRGGLGRDVNARLNRKHDESGDITGHVLQHAPDTSQERFLFQLPSIDEGAWSFAGEVEISRACLGQTEASPTGGSNTIRRAHTLSYVARGVDFGVEIERAGELLELESSKRVDRNFAWRGNFSPQSEVQLWRGDSPPHAGDSHACVHVKYGDVRLGYSAANALNLRSDSGGSGVLTVEVGPDCGWEEDDRPRELPIRVRLPETGDESVTTLRYTLSNKLTAGDEGVVQIAPGGEASTRWGPTTKSGGTRSFAITVDKSASEPSWPKGLSVDVMTAAEANEHKTLRRKRARESQRRFSVSDQDVTQPLVMRFRATNCCESDEYRVPVRITAVTDGATGVPLTQMLVIQVSEGSWIACWLPRILWALFLLLLLILLVIFYRLIKYTVLIDDRRKNSLQSITLTLGSPGGALERDDSAKMLLDGRRWPLGNRLSRKLRLMAEGFGSAARRKPWYETYRYHFGTGLISTPPTFVSGVGGLADYRNSSSSGSKLQSGLYVCAEGNGGAALWVVNPSAMGYVLAPVDDEPFVVREIMRGRRRDDEEEAAMREATPTRIRRNVLIDTTLGTSRRGDWVGYEIQG